MEMTNREVTMNCSHAKRIVPLFLIGMMLSIYCGALWGQNLEIHYINVQQGQSTLIVGPDGTTILFDGGYETKGTNEVVPYLNSIGISPRTNLDYVIASHRDTDHFVGLTEVINYGYKPQHVYDNGSDKYNTYVQSFLNAAATTPAGGVTALLPGTVINLGGGATATCVAANGSVIGTGAIAGGTSDENDRAICLLIKYNNFDFLLNGDMGGGALDNACTGRYTTQINMESPTVMAIMPAGVNPLLSQYGVEVAHVGHHGSESSTNPDYMNILTPRVACISVGGGQSSSYMHPRIDVVEHVLLAGSPCITAPAALVLQTEEGNPAGATTSFAGNCVGDIVISTDGVDSYTVSANGAVSQGPDERVAAGLPATYYFEEYSAVDNSPIIYGVDDVGTGMTSTQIVWSTNETADSVVNYGTSSGSYTYTANDASPVLNHLVTLSGLSEYTTYYYVVASTDSTGHTTTSPEYSFQTETSGAITVLSPNGGESLTIGSAYNITWSSAGTVGNVNIDYSTDSGGNWVSIISNTENDGLHAWTVPNAASTTCLVRVQETDGSPTDSSNAFFSIIMAAEGTITVTSPNGGESWTIGTAHNITWTSTGTVGNLNIDYSTDSGTNWTAVATGEINDGSYSWTVPNTASTTCLVRVQETDGSPTDSSNAVFSITAASSVVGVIFSEVYYDTIGTDDIEEWAELYNNLATAVDIGNWTISDNNGAGTPVTIPAGTIMAPKSYLTVALNQAGFRNLYPYDADIYGTGFLLGNSGDVLILKDSGGTEKDAVCWENGFSGAHPSGWGSTALPIANRGFTIVRSDVTIDTNTYADWATSPAANNGFPQTQLISSPIVFSEVYYDTVGVDAIEEWIELYNKAPVTVNIGGRQIIDNNGGSGTATFTIPAGTTMAPHSYLTIAANKAGFNALYHFDADIYGTLPALGNSGDALLLKDDLGILRDTVAWEGGTAAGVPAGWGSSTLPTAPTGSTIVRIDVTIDTDTYADWTTAGSNGNPETQLEDVIAVTSPNGGESWIVGTAHDITWGSTGSVGNVNIDYSTDSGSTWSTITINTGNDGLYSWTIPNTASTTCLVRVSETSDSATSDSSDTVFTIVPAVTTHTISGTILIRGLPLAGVVLSGLPGDPITDASGAYSATVDDGWSGTVTPVLDGYRFRAVSRNYVNVTADQTAQDYRAVAVIL